MPQKYTDDQKLNALRLLAETFGNTTYVAAQTGISVRTLQYWKQSYSLQVTIQVDDPDNPADKYLQEQYQHLRTKLFNLIGDMFHFLEHARSADAVARLTPALARLIDRLAKLEEMSADKDFTLKIQWVNPDITIDDKETSIND